MIMDSCIDQNVQGLNRLVKDMNCWIMYSDGLFTEKVSVESTALLG